LFPFVGRLGDALVSCACFRELARDKSAAVTFAATAATRGFLGHVDAPIDRIPYPVTFDQLAGFTHHLSLEGLDDLPGARGRSLGDLFSECLGTPRPTRPAPVGISDAVRSSWLLEGVPRPRVGIQLTRPRSPRSYPVGQALELSRLLVERRTPVLLLGRTEEVTDALPHHPPWIHNLVGRTRTVEELAAVVGQLDLLVSPDSLLMHLAAALGVANLVLFTSTDPVLAGDYPLAEAMTSGVTCCPCGVAEGACPEGYSTCVGPDHPNLRPGRIARAIAAKLKTIEPIRPPALDPCRA
jgi:hypothetical protein